MEPDFLRRLNSLLSPFVRRYLLQGSYRWKEGKSKRADKMIVYACRCLRWRTGDITSEICGSGNIGGDWDGITIRTNFTLHPSLHVAFRGKGETFKPPPRTGSVDGDGNGIVILTRQTRRPCLLFVVLGPQSSSVDEERVNNIVLLSDPPSVSASRFHL